MHLCLIGVGIVGLATAKSSRQFAKLVLSIPSPLMLRRCLNRRFHLGITFFDASAIKNCIQTTAV